MGTKVIIKEKRQSGDLVSIDEREWSEAALALLNHANYLLVNGKEYEMLEGRLNVNDQSLEILAVEVAGE